MFTSLAAPSYRRTAAEVLMRAAAREEAARVRYPAPPVDGPDRNTREAEVRDEVYSLGPHPEDGEERFGTRYNVTLVNAYGERFEYRWSFLVEAWALRLAKLAEAATRAGRGDPRTSPKWAPASPVYGSLAYEHGVGGGAGADLAMELAEDGAL